ncbi:MAG: methyl-accepting chemotaxis protein [Phycisphaerales bacterium]|nr:methyl-accepting chemotaxis protein [Phycisphaerales bacterium]
MASWFKNLGLGTRIIALTVVVLVTLIAVNYVVFVNKYKDSAAQAMVERAAAFTALADETKNHVASLHKTGAFDSVGLAKELQDVQAKGGSYRDTAIFKAVPVVAGWTAGQQAASREGIDFTITSFEARNKENEPDRGSFSEDLLRKLTTQVEQGGAEWISGTNTKTNTLHYMRAIKLSDDCLTCHGARGSAGDPDGDGKDIVGFPMEDWKVGYMHGAYEVKMPLKAMDAQVASFISSGLMFSAPLFIGSVVLFIFVLRWVFQKPMAALTARVRDIAEGEGDLTQRVDVKSGDELGTLGKYFNLFITKVHDVILEVVGSAEGVAAASTQIAASGEEMASGMQRQSSQVAQISSAVEEMSASVNEVARKSNETATESRASGDAAAEGGQIVRQTIEGMNAINDAVASSAQSVQELGKRGEQIGEIITVINDIADQTNLLALNAAIEAARAGEHGRGFAVVADEVRKLADRTTKATEEIAQSIKAIQQETVDAVQRMEAGTSHVKQGVDRATKAGESLDQIVHSARQVAGMVNEIAAAAEEQSQASSEISRSIEEINAVSSETSRGASESARAAAQLSAQAEGLLSLVGQFRVNR